MLELPKNQWGDSKWYLIPSEFPSGGARSLTEGGGAAVRSFCKCPILPASYRSVALLYWVVKLESAAWWWWELTLVCSRCTDAVLLYSRFSLDWVCLVMVRQWWRISGACFMFLLIVAFRVLYYSAAFIVDCSLLYFTSLFLKVFTKGCIFYKVLSDYWICKVLATKI